MINDDLMKIQIMWWFSNKQYFHDNNNLDENDDETDITVHIYCTTAYKEKTGWALN